MDETEKIDEIRDICIDALQCDGFYIYERSVDFGSFTVKTGKGDVYVRISINE